MIPSLGIEPPPSRVYLNTHGHNGDIQNSPKKEAREVHKQADEHSVLHTDNGISPEPHYSMSES